MKKKNTLLIIALLLLVGISSIFVAGTYAKYTSTISGVSGTASIAKWTFRTNNESVTMNIVFDQTYNPSTLVANKIAPGTSGTFTIALSNAGGETGVDYTLKFGTVDPSIAGLTLKNGSTTLTSGSTVTGHIDPNESETVTIDWEWEYESGNDSADTTLGETDGASLSVPVTITGVQTQPSA